MWGNRIKLVKESLEYLVNQMNDDDSFALVTFTDTAKVINDLTIMNSNNKAQVLNNINSLSADGNTMILSGLMKGLDLIKHDYSTENKVCSMILLSDGIDYDYVVDNFKNYISSEGKNNYSFTLHCFGYGDDHNSELLNKIALIREGGYFNIRKLFMVKDYFLEIYGSLSTVYKVNVNIKVQSNFEIQKVYGIEDMNQASLTDFGTNFSIILLHLVYGKIYQFVILLNITENIKVGDKVLNATISPFDKTITYFWNQTYNPYAYEEYIRCISMSYFIESFNAGQELGINIIDNGIDWIKSNYDGIRNWLKEFKDIREDLNNFESFGKANILSKLRELKFSKLGIYDNENSYQKKIIDDSYKIDVKEFNQNKVTGKYTVSNIQNYNYFYFYLKHGIGEINNLHFSGTESSIIIYSEKTKQISINSLTDSIEYYYKFENKTRIQTIIDFSRGGKFIYKKDFPFDFYVRIDGKKDITFNIQFIKFETEEIFDLQDYIFEINAYIVDEQNLEILQKDYFYTPNNPICKGFYDKGFRIGKIVLRTEEIYKYLNPNSQNYLYIIVKKAKNSNIIYNYVEGQFSFVSMDYIYSIAPENSYIFSNFSIGQRTPHLYTLKMDSNLNKIMRIEFATSSNELDCKIIKYQKYLPGTEEFYLDNAQLNITRKNHLGKTYIDITQSNSIQTKIDTIILSIFSKNGDHIAGSEIHKLSYTIRYSTNSDLGIYNFNDIYNKDGEIEFFQSEKDERNFTIKFYPLKSAKNDGEYIQETTRFFIKVFPIIKLKQKLYQTISLFESTPEIYIEKNINNENETNFQIQIEPDKNHFFTIYTISNKNYEILSYKIKKTYILPSNIEIKDDNFFEDELLGDQTFEFYISENNENNYLIIGISGFENGNYGIIYAQVEDKIYKSVQPSDNIIIN